MTEKQTEHLLSGPAQQYSFYMYSRLLSAIQEHADKIGRSASWVMRQAAFEYLEKAKEAEKDE
jgi:predicted transcriptional regulator